MSVIARFILGVALFFFIFIGLGKLTDTSVRQHTYTVGDTTYSTVTTSNAMGESKCSSSVDGNGNVSTSCN